MDRYKYRFLSLSLYLYLYIDFIGWWILVRTQHKHFLDTSTDNHKKYLTTKQTSKMYARIYTPIIYVYIYIYICVCVCVCSYFLGLDRIFSPPPPPPPTSDCNCL